MSLIYQRAYNTVIWLGPADASNAFEAIQRLNDGVFGTNTELLDDAQKARLCSEPHIPAGGYEATQRFFGHP
jgi:hypothetical protein